MCKLLGIKHISKATRIENNIQHERNFFESNYKKFIKKTIERKITMAKNQIVLTDESQLLTDLKNRGCELKSVVTDVKIMTILDLKAMISDNVDSLYDLYDYPMEDRKTHSTITEPILYLKLGKYSMNLGSFDNASRILPLVNEYLTKNNITSDTISKSDANNIQSIY